MKTTCAYCGIVDRPHICPYRKRRTDRTRIDNKIYESKEYRKLRKEVLEDFNYVDVFSFYIEDKGITEYLGNYDDYRDTKEKQLSLTKGRNR